MALTVTQGSFVVSLKAPPDITCNLLYLVRLIQTNLFFVLFQIIFIFFLFNITQKAHRSYYCVTL